MTETRTWMNDLGVALVILLVGVLGGLVWNPSALRDSEIQITEAAGTASYLVQVSPKEVLNGLDDGTMQVVDSRQRPVYEAAHIPGALPVWDAKVEFIMPSLLRLLARTTTVVIVDEKVEGYGGRRIAGLFAARGYPNVRLLSGGMEEWREKNRPIAKGWDFDAIKKWATAR